MSEFKYELSQTVKHVSGENTINCDRLFILCRMHCHSAGGWENWYRVRVVSNIHVTTPLAICDLREDELLPA